MIGAGEVGGEYGEIFAWLIIGRESEEGEEGVGARWEKESSEEAEAGGRPGESEGEGVETGVDVRLICIWKM